MRELPPGLCQQPRASFDLILTLCHFGKEVKQTPPPLAVVERDLASHLHLCTGQLQQLQQHQKNLLTAAGASPAATGSDHEWGRGAGYGQESSCVHLELKLCQSKLFLKTAWCSLQVMSSAASIDYSLLLHLVSCFLK